MILEIDADLYKYYFPEDPHPFVSESFLQLNSAKADKIVRLIQDSEKVQMGLVAGIRDNILLSPFSAPFGGFHFRNEQTYPSVMEAFLHELKQYAVHKGLSGIKIVLPPDIYSGSSNAKLVNVMTRMGFQSLIPEVTNWVDLHKFNDMYSLGVSRTYYNQAVKKGLQFHELLTADDKGKVYELIVANRTRMGRPIYMSFEDILKTADVFPTDFFKVTNKEGAIVAGAIMYRAHAEIAFAVFWGDTVDGRPDRAMDFLVLHLWRFYKSKGYKYLDLGISTESGIPNEGLLRFKETHECISSIRHSFICPINSGSLSNN